MLSFLRHFIKYHLDKQRLFYTILIVLFSTSAIVLYWVAVKETRATLSNEFLHREQVIARSGSQSISGFINLLGKSLTLMAEDFSDDTPLGDKQVHVASFMDHWRDTPVSAILLADKNGKVIAQANRSGPPEINVSVANRPYFNWSITAKKGEYLVGHPVMGVFGYVKGKYIITIASPIVVNGNFTGVVAVAVVLNDLTDYFITPIKISDNTRIFLFDENGVVLSSLTDNLIGTNYFDFLSGYSYQGRDKTVNGLRTALISSVPDGELDINLPDSLNPGSFGEFLVAYSKVRVDNHYWLLAIKSPVSDSSIFLWRVKDLIFIALIFTIVLVITFSITNLQAEKQRRRQNST